MRRVDVITVGSAVKDVTFYSEDVSIIKNPKDITRQMLMAVEYGAKIELDEVFVNYGGGALNVGLGLHNFGLSVAPMICIGRDWVGKEVLSFMRGNGLRTDLVMTDKILPTGFSVIITAAKDREHTIFTYKGATKRLTVPDDVCGLNASWLYVSPLSMGNWVEEIKKLFNEVDRHKQRSDSRRLKFAWNPGSRQVREMPRVEKFLPLVDILFVNKDEAIEMALSLFGRRIGKTKLNQARYLLDLLKKTGIKNIVVTAGAKGVYGVDETGRYYWRPIKSRAKIVDTVGAGDSLAAGFLAAWHYFHDFERALGLGLRNSASVISRIGAQNGLLKIKLK